RLIIDRRLTRNGYGIVHIDKKARRYILECWPWNADPLAGAQQYEGWPIVVPFPKPAQPQSRSVLPGQPNRP
ncbi:MAG: hypothetical protein ACE5K7_06840, partial [Phycisphaerae bacterium]